MQVEIVDPAYMMVRTLSQDDQLQFKAWVESLKRWDTDEAVRSHAYSLEAFPDTYVLHAGAELRLFMTVKANKIEVFDIAKQAGLLAMAGVKK